MKKSYFYLVRIFLFGIAVNFIVGCTDQNSGAVPVQSGASFPCLIYTKGDSSQWPNLNTFQSIIFNSFDSNAVKPWQLITYGQTVKDPILNFQFLAGPFQPYTDTILRPNATILDSTRIDSTNMAIGNLVVKATLFRNIIRDNKNGANLLLCVPYVDKQKFKHLSYRLYLAKRISKTRIQIVYYDSTLYADGEIKAQADGGYVPLNPCPPFHDSISSANSYIKR